MGTKPSRITWLCSCRLHHLFSGLLALTIGVAQTPALAEPSQLQSAGTGVSEAKAEKPASPIPDMAQAQLTAVSSGTTAGQAAPPQTVVSLPAGCLGLALAVERWHPPLKPPLSVRPALLAACAREPAPQRAPALLLLPVVKCGEVLNYTNQALATCPRAQ